jgi:hypothetical protein
MAKTVHIKATTIELKIKTNGLELQIDEKGGGQFGDIFVTKTGIIWCKGKTTRPKGVKIDYETLNDICINLAAVKDQLKKLKKTK